MIDDFAITWVQWLILSFAAYRLTQFFVYDSLIGGNPESGSKQSVRLDRFAYDSETGQDRSFLRGKVGDLLTCPWCLGFWLSAASYLLFVAATDRWTGTAVVVHGLTIFSIAGLQGFLNSHTP